MQEWYLGREKVSCLERCPQFRNIFYREVPHCSSISFLNMYNHKVYTAMIAMVMTLYPNSSSSAVIMVMSSSTASTHAVCIAG